MDYNFNTKYKDVPPKQTIKNIENFFIKQGGYVKIVQQITSEIDTYSCRVEFCINNQTILGANGKGITEDYALASGYAELYERFCSKMNYIQNPFFFKNLCLYNKYKNNYFLDKDEIILTEEELLNSCDIIHNAILAYTKNDKEKAKKIIQLFCCNNPIGIPYKNFNDINNTIYIDPRVLYKINGSIGLAAGNTVEEALNQGFSEICEHYALEQFFQNIQNQYYEIDIKSIQNTKIKDILIKAEQNNFQIKIFDLSYNFNVPVLMSALIDNINYKIIINFGSFPIFDIACERILTELYQGIKTYDYIDEIYSLKPYKSVYTLKPIREITSNISNGEIVPETLFLNSIKVQNNSNIFINNSTTTINNFALNTYFNSLFKKLNWNIYYKDISMCDEIKTIHAIAVNLPLNTDNAFNINSFSPIILNDIINYLFSCNNFIASIYSRENIKNQLEDFLNKDFNIHNKYMNNQIIGQFLGNDIFNIYTKSTSENINTSFAINGLCQGILNENIISCLSETVSYQPCKIYKIIQDYIDCKNYTQQEIKNIIKSIFNTEITNEDIEKCHDGWYLLNKIYIEPFQQEIQSDTYQKMIAAFSSNY